MDEQTRAALRDLADAIQQPGRPDNIGVVVGGSLTGLIGAMLDARGLALWLVPLMLAYLLAMAVVAVHLVRLIIRRTDPDADYPTDEDGLPKTGLEPPTPPQALDRQAKAMERLADAADRLRQTLERWERPQPPDRWEQMVRDVVDAHQREHHGPD